MHNPRGSLRALSGLVLALALPGFSPARAGETATDPLALIVMDPLAKELACACVKGFAQRDYGRVAALLEKELRQPVLIDFSDNLADSMAKFSTNRDILVIGKDSVVRQGAGPAGLKCRPIAQLTDLDGTTTFTGLFVTRSSDSASALKDLTARKVLFGPKHEDEKHSAALAALRAAGVKPPETLETRASCSEAALDVMDSSSSPAPVAVISSYALALLEGCGSIKKGDLKVIGKTEPVPFITAFVAESMSTDKQSKVLNLFLSLKSNATLLKALESKQGFTPVEVSEPTKLKSSAVGEWPDWRGPGRDGHVPQLPARLPVMPRFVWKKAAVTGGLSGLIVANGRLLVAERDLGNQNDVVRCLDADTGEPLWRAEFPAAGKLDYGEAPRAAPVTKDGRVFALGAFGDLRCLDLKTGTLLWRRQLMKEFKAKLPTWGTCSTPLLVDGMLIVNPGAPEAALAALDCATGRTLWKTPGNPAAYASFICAELGGRRQVVGYDQQSLGGWDPKTGERLWKLVPPSEGDFNVPTPAVADGKLIAATENNATRLYGFDSSGKIIPKPMGEFADLSPDTTSPVAANGRIVGTHQGVHCLDVRQNLKSIWRWEDDEIGEHASLFASRDRVLIVTLGGELILLTADGDRCQVLSRTRVFADDVEIYSHPALVGTRLYVRGGSTLACVDLAGD